MSLRDSVRNEEAVMDSRNDIIVYAEYNEKKEIDRLTLECLGAGRRLADDWGCGLGAVIIGENMSGPVNELINYSVDHVYVADSPGLKEFHPELYCGVMARLCRKIEPRAVLFGNTLPGLDLAPRVSFSLDTGLVTDCVAMWIEEGRVVLSKPVYSGNVIAEYNIESKPAVITVRAKTQEKAQRCDAYNGKIIPIAEMIDEKDVTVRVMERVLELEEGPQLDDADIIVAGGRGIGSKEGFGLLAELAKTLGAALGASRPPCDLGWINAKAQVGQTGEIVGPSVYIAVGISGSTQHIVGMYTSRTIIAINKDAQAPIFDIADYGIVGNYEEIIPSFSNALVAECV
jgi:electron transfer flavoprotein alpha subunit